MDSPEWLSDIYLSHELQLLFDAPGQINGPFEDLFQGNNISSVEP